MSTLANLDVRRLEHALALLGRRAGPLHAILAQRAGVALDRVGCQVLKAASRGSVRVTDLARELSVEVPTMSRHVANLTQAGYLVKTPDPTDGRVWWVELTSKAEGAMRRLETERRRVLSDLFSGWTRSERDAFVELLDRFSSDLTRHTE